MLLRLNIAIKEDIAEEHAARRNTLRDGFSISDHRRLLSLAAVKRSIASVPPALSKQVDQLALRDDAWIEHTLIELRYALGCRFMPENATAFLQRLIENAHDIEAQANFHIWLSRQEEMRKELIFQDVDGGRLADSCQ